MNQYLEKFDSHLSNIKNEAEKEENPHRSKIFWNYLHHGAFETGGDWERIFTPELTVEEPHYEMRTESDETIVLDGKDVVEEFYAAIEDEHMMLIDDGNHQLFANDNGLAEFATTVEFVPGKTILDDGLDKWYYKDAEIDDPDATYVKNCRHAMFWPFTDEAQLIGEMVYQAEPYDISKADPKEVPPLDQIESVAENYYPENIDGETPFPDV